MNIKLFTAAITMLAVLAAALGGTTGSADAKLTCKNVGKRWQVCGEAKPFKSFSLGVGFRFSKKQLELTSN